MARTSDWPLGEGVRVPAVAHRAPARHRPLPRATWAIAVAAFLCGAALSAALFSVGWRHQAERGSSAQAALAVATAHARDLSHSLATTRATLATVRQREAAAAAAERTLARRASALADSVLAAGRTAGSVSGGAASVGTNVDKLASELRTLTQYLTSTPTAQLDGGYVATQTAYLSKQLDQLRAARSDLDAAAAGFAQAAKTLADRASALGRG